jgi:hypothetical protein
MSKIVGLGVYLPGYQVFFSAWIDIPHFFYGYGWHNGFTGL